MMVPSFDKKDHYFENLTIVQNSGLYDIIIFPSVYRILSYSHSMVDGGFEEMS